MADVGPSATLGNAPARLMSDVSVADKWVCGTGNGCWQGFWTHLSLGDVSFLKNKGERRR